MKEDIRMEEKCFVNESFRTATKDLIAFISTIPREACTYRPPDVEDAWTIQEHIVHLADSEANAFLRLKTIVASPGTETFVIDENLWTREIDAHGEDMDEYVELLRTLRDIEYGFLTRLDYDANREKYVVHPKEQHLDIVTWVKWYGTDHFAFHQKLILRNLERWSVAIGG